MSGRIEDMIGWVIGALVALFIVSLVWLAGAGIAYGEHAEKACLAKGGIWLGREFVCLRSDQVIR